MTDKKSSNTYMRRCFALAHKGGVSVKTNPHVGCVIVANDRIIGEGYHEVFGGPHAEVNALASVKNQDRSLLSEATLYVSLEPCHHQGKTPPCVDAILEVGIPRVVISCLDPNPLTHGKSIAKLRSAGVEVIAPYLEEEGQEVIASFQIQQTKQRPYVILKWAQSKDGYMGKEGEQVWLTNPLSKWITHRWRSEIAGILVGTDTAIVDNPRLTNRRGHGLHPHRILLDRQGRVPIERALLSDDHATTIFTCQQDYPSLSAEKRSIVIPSDMWSWEVILSELYKMNLGSVMIEGGKKVLRSVIKEGLWDEARVFHTSSVLEQGIKAPSISGRIKKRYHIRDDKAFIIKPFG